MSKDGQNKIYQMVTDDILAALKNGTVPWRKSWNGMFPVSLSTGKPYRGINPFILGMVGAMRGHTSQYWGTYNKIAELAGMVKDGLGRWTSPDGTPRGVRAGEKSTVVVFWKRLLVNDDKSPDGKKAIFMLRYYRVFNPCQADGLPAKYFASTSAAATADVVESAEKAIAAYFANGPTLVKVPGDSAHYLRQTDTVTLPLDSQFTSAAGRYETTFHEAAHSTGHPSRLARPELLTMRSHGDEPYAKEELVAQMAASMCLGIFNIAYNVEMSADYIAGWLSALSNDHSLVISAAAQAQKAADMICGITFGETDSD